MGITFIQDPSDNVLFDILMGKPDFISLDTETTGLDPYVNELLTYQLKIFGEIFVFDSRRIPTEVSKDLFQAIEDSGIKILLHNATFDLKFIYTKFGVLLTNVHDTMYTETILTAGLGSPLVSLDSLVEKYCGVNIDKSERETFLTTDLITPLTQNQINYAATDVLYLESIYKEQMIKIKEDKLTKVYDLEMNLIPVVASMELNGIILNKDAWNKLTEEAKTTAENLKKELKDTLLSFISYSGNGLQLSQKLHIPVSRKRDQQALELITDSGVLKTWVNENFNLNSHLQLKTLLELAGIKVVDTNEKTLKKFGRNKTIDLLLEYREAVKRLTTYGDNIVGLINPITGRIHTHYINIGAVTGRVASNSPNMQNIPTKHKEDDPDYREPFEASERFTLVAMDYSQQELRLVGAISNEKKMIDAYLNDVDIHTTTASLIFNKPISEITKDERYLGKTVNFACLPMDTDVLTKTGWKRYNDISVGEYVMGYNQEKDSQEWTLVKGKVFYQSAPTVNIHATGLDLTCTPNHRWYGQKRVRVHGKKDRYVKSIFTPDDLIRIKNPDYKFTLSSVYKSEDRLINITDDEAEIIGWLFSDGSVKISCPKGITSQGLDNSRQGTEASIFQSRTHNPNKIKEILRVLSNVKYSLYNRPTGITQFRLSPPYARDLLKRAGLFEKLDFTHFVLSLTHTQRDAFISSIILAEGYKKNGGSQRFYQNTGGFLDACILAFFLSGKFISFTDRPQYTGNNNRDVCIRKGTFTTQNIVISHKQEQPVFCLETDLNTFIARQKEIPFITGNTLYGTTEFGLKYNLQISLDKALQMINAFYSGYSSLATFKNAVEDKIIELGYSITPLGRRRYWNSRPLFSDTYETQKHFDKMKREGFNFIIQGGGADITKIAMCNLFYNNPFGDKFRILLQVHDEIVAEIHDSILDKAIEFMKEQMLNAEQPFLGKVPAAVDYKAGKKWSK